MWTSGDLQYLALEGNKTSYFIEPTWNRFKGTIYLHARMNLCFICRYQFRSYIPMNPTDARIGACGWYSVTGPAVTLPKQ